MSKHLFIDGPLDGQFHDVPRVGTAWSLRRHDVKIDGGLWQYFREPFYLHEQEFDIFISKFTMRDKKLNKRVVKLLKRAGLV